MTEEEEAAWKEKADDPWVVNDIKLDIINTEQHVFDLLLQTLDNNSIEKVTKTPNKTTVEQLPMNENVRLRAVGGWIRDKLLQQEGWIRSAYPISMDEDIDIVIETDHKSDR